MSRVCKVVEEWNRGAELLRGESILVGKGVVEWGGLRKVDAWAGATRVSD